METLKTYARTHIEVLCNCPYCDAYEDIFDNDHIKETFGRNGEVRAEGIDLEVKCSECGKEFIVENIEF